MSEPHVLSLLVGLSLLLGGAALLLRLVPQFAARRTLLAWLAGGAGVLATALMMRLTTVLSTLLVEGLLVGCTALTLSALARFYKHRATLGWIAVAGFAAFVVGLLGLTPPPLRLITLYFWVFTAAVIGGGLGCVTVRNVFHAALMLILSLFGVAGYFILVNAEFLAMVQVIIYIGGIMVLFLFGIMVSQNIIGTELKQYSPQTPYAALSAAVLFAFMVLVGLFMSFPPQPNVGQGVIPNNTLSLGWSLMATYTLPFMVASVLLLMAMLGAIVLVRKD